MGSVSPWLRVKCPVSQEARDWIEDSFRWLTAEYGPDALHGEVLLPETVFPEGRYSASEPEVADIVRRLCARIGVDPNTVDIEWVEPDDNSDEMRNWVPIASHSAGAAAHYQSDEGRSRLIVSQRQRQRPRELVATLAHELAHARLLGEERIDPTRRDHEQLTDLATVFFGLGVFTANAAFEHSQGQRGWQTSQLGYLGEQLFGYALAVYAHRRGEAHPDWGRRLDTNPRVYMRRGLRFLDQSGLTRSE